ncbi:RNA degradosome polyphosphate kinase [Prevotella copri]|uniref:RNA degradosome polyphosphate kinase n=2 Tax=Prevotellaceae TaxID=171552 RepID=UPI001C380F3F|nr:RNA degradosome polyphosphate kinase [Segatella copri]MBV3414239.1 RNA degradosome polyphosphate kinase [Segatella copri]
MTKQEVMKKAYVERDVSWMYFNHRILQEAEKEFVPLLERLSFLGIYSNNLDEFFRVRVASLNRMLERKLDKDTEQQIKKSLKTINKLNESYSKEYTEAVDKVFEELETHKIRLVTEANLNDEQKDFLSQFFYDKLNGSVNPIWLSEIEDLTVLEDNRIYLIVEKCEKKDNKKKYAIVKVPDRIYGRWVKIPSSDGFDNIMYLDDVIRYCLPLVFLGFKESTYRAYSFKFTKDAEMEMDNDADFGTMEKIALGVNSRKKGEAVRVIYDHEMPREMQRKLRDRLNTKELDASLAGGRYQNHKDLMSFPDCGRNDLKYDKWTPIMKPEFVSNESILDQIRQKDRFIHVPYHNFNGYIRVLREAAIKPEVKSIKTTLYRLAKDSKVVKALITAARNGKKVTAVVELLARFDEESNIKWSKRMQEEGVNVIFGVEGLKIHSKLLYIESKKGNIACIGTGNFHEGNAKIYTDYLMMTARPKIVNEVAKVFDFIDRPFSPFRFSELLVSPNSMKSRILRMLDTEIRNASEGKEAWVKIKINHITDTDMVTKLYQASKAGVKIDIVIRGNCSLVPGIKGLSENIRCVGIIDRYLEHSRILIFANGGKPRYFLGSADWMPRNLLNRIEVLTPVYDEELQADLMRTISYGMRDTTNGRIVDGKGTNNFVEGEPFRSQQELYKEYKK